MATSDLFACPSCQNGCANNADSCPSCGHVFHQAKVRPGDGWGMTIFWGIMLAWIIPTLVMAAFVILLIVLGIGTAALAPLAQPSERASPTPTVQR